MSNPEHPAVSAILSELRRELKRQGIRAAHLADKLGVAEPTIWRWLRGEALTLTNLSEICSVAGLDLRDLIESSPGTEQESFTLAQERILAADRRLSLVFFAILNGAQRDELERDFGLGGARLEEYLSRLHRLDLIDRAANGRLRPRTRRTVRWRRGGPLATEFERTIKPFFLSLDFGSASARYESQMVRLSEAGQARVVALFEALRNDIHLIAHEDRASRIEPAEWCAVLMLVRALDLNEITDEWRNELNDGK